MKFNSFTKLRTVILIGAPVGKKWPQKRPGLRFAGGVPLRKIGFAADLSYSAHGVLDTRNAQLT
jgi:hypothetical protein